MATNAYDLLVRIEASTEALRRELNAGEGAVSNFTKNVNNHLSNLDKGLSGINQAFSALKGAAAAFGVGLGVGELISLARGSLEFANELKDTSAQLGITIENLQLYRQAARDFDAEQNALVAGVRNLQVTLGEAASGNEEAARKFKQLHIEIRDGAGNLKTYDQILLEFADVIAGIEDPATKAAAAAFLLGNRLGPQLVPLLNQGKQGLEDYFDTIRGGSRIMSDEVAQRLADANVAIQNFQTQLTIAIGNFLSFMTELEDKTRLAGGELKLDRINNEIQQLTTQTQELQALTAQQRAGIGPEAVDEEIRRNQEALRELRVEAENLRRFLGIAPPQAHAGRGTVVTIKPPVTVDLSKPGSGGAGQKSEAEKAAERLQSEIDNVRSKIQELNAEAAGDTFGELLAESFGRLNIELDQTSPKLEELKGLLRELATATDEQAIAEEGYKAAVQADAEAVREYEQKLSDVQDMLDETRSAQEIYNDSIAEYRQLLEDGMITQEQFNRLVQHAGQSFVEADAASQRLIQSARQVGEGFVDAFGRIIMQTTSAKNALADFLNVLAQVLANLAGGGIETWLGNLLAAGMTTAATGAVEPGGAGTPWLAKGGRVQAGRMYMVGERGPEPFVPDVPGTVIPAGQGLGNNVTLNQTINLNTNGGGTPQQNRDLADRAGAVFERAMKNQVESTIAYHLRDRGMFRPNVVG